MQLLTKEIEAKLPMLYSQSEANDPMVYHKLFFPAGSGTWFIYEGERQEDGDYLMFGLGGPFGPKEWEYGYSTLNEVAAVRGPFGLGIERDRHFRPKPLSEVKKEYGL